MQPTAPTAATQNLRYDPLNYTDPADLPVGLSVAAGRPNKPKHTSSTTGSSRARSSHRLAALSSFLCLGPAPAAPATTTSPTLNTTTGSAGCMPAGMMARRLFGRSSKKSEGGSGSTTTTNTASLSAASAGGGCDAARTGSSRAATGTIDQACKDSSSFGSSTKSFTAASGTGRKKWQVDAVAVAAATSPLGPSPAAASDTAPAADTRAGTTTPLALPQAASLVASGGSSSLLPKMAGLKQHQRRRWARGNAADETAQAALADAAPPAATDQDHLCRQAGAKTSLTAGSSWLQQLRQYEQSHGLMASSTVGDSSEYAARRALNSHAKRRVFELLKQQQPEVLAALLQEVFSPTVANAAVRFVFVSGPATAPVSQRVDAQLLLAWERLAAAGGHRPCPAGSPEMRARRRAAKLAKQQRLLLACAGVRV